MRTSRSERKELTSWRENTRIVWAITAKDLLEAIKNKNTITILITSLLMVFFYRYMPAIFDESEPLPVLVYDAGNSTLIAHLENSQNLDIYTYPTEEKMKEYLGHGDIPEVGLVIPQEFDQAMAAGEQPTLQGYLMYWVSDADAVEATRTVEAEISRIVSRPVEIQTQGNIVYHTPESGGIGVMAGFSLIFIITMVGVTLVGHLFLEEKQSRTIETLLVSPATAGQIVLGKAITGLVYCLLGAGIALAINQDLIIHWWLVSAMVIATSLFTVSLGLLLGSIIENRGQLTLWAWVILIPLMIPLFLTLLDDLVPATAVQIMRQIPTVTGFNLLRTSLANPIPVGTALLQLGWVLLWAGVVLTGTAWVVRRQEVGTGQASLWDRARQGLFSKIQLAAPPGMVTTLPAEEILPGRSRVTEKAVPRPDAGLSLEHATRKDAGRTERPEWQGLRIPWAIAGKDIREALHNKIFISVILGVVVMIASNAVIPLLLQGQDKPALLVYDEGRSTILRGLTGEDEFRIGLVDSRQALEEAITESHATYIGLVLPADFDQKAGSSEAIQLEGFAAHWTDQDKIDQWKRFFENQLASATWTEVNIYFGDDRLYPGAEAGGNPIMVTTLLVIVIVTMGSALVPLLLIEEKENHTMEALLASPTTLTQLLSGKALAGITFCLVAGSVVILFYQHLFVHWWIVLLAVLLSAAFAVAVGLLIGTVSDNPATTGMWGALIIIALAALTILQFLQLESVPPLLQSVLSWFPGGRLVNLFRFSMTAAFPLAQVLPSIAVLAAEAAALYALAGLLMRRAYA